MSIFSALYQLLIRPLEFFFDVLYSVSFRVIGNQGLSIIVLSLCMNFLVLPLYRKADAMQAEERELERKLQPRIRQIRQTFRGDERFMMLQTYYRQNQYKPSYALKGSLSLLLEIPFFIAAYRFLSGLSLLEGVPFGPIRDLGAPDALIRLGDGTLNLLPILMTAVNLISGFIYTRGLPVKSKIQLYGMALIFLVFLYSSPAGLVFYWTLNNLFSLVKNVFYRLKRPGFTLCCLSSAAGAALLAFLLFVRPLDTAKHQLYAAAVLLLLQLPLAVYLLRRRRPAAPPPEITRQDRALFLLGCVFLTLLTGLLIPGAVIASSPEEFVDIYAFRSPLLYVLSSLLLAAGTFVVWLGVFYALSGPRGKRVMELGVWIASGCGLLDYFFFGTDLGTLSPMLELETPMAFTLRQQLLNLLALAVLAALLFFVWRKRKGLARWALIAAGVAILCMSAADLVRIQGQTGELKQSLRKNSLQTGQDRTAELPSVSLGKNGKNVVVIMLDRAISGYFPFLINEKPELQEQLSGFVYYPNTISFGGYTNVGAPGLFGGYEYTPAEMNRRSGELLKDKHDEALKVMPVLFAREGFRVTVCDPPYAGYQWVPDLSIYADYPEIRAYITKGRFREDQGDAAARTVQTLNRNFFCYGLLKSLPLAAQPFLYDHGMYSECNAMFSRPTQTRFGLLRSSGTSTGFMDAFTVLTSLPSITEVEQGEDNCFVLMNNDATHDTMMLQEPDYLPAENADNTAYEAEHPVRTAADGRALSLETEAQILHYQCNMAALLALGDWFDSLRDQGIYDNTRIIIVADHGRELNEQLEELCFFDGQLDAMKYNPLLLVKDFGSAGGIRTDRTFMTNADVPTLAVGGLIRDPVNPFTGKPIGSEAKGASEQYILATDIWDTGENGGTVFLPAPWYAVHDDIFSEENWRLNAEEPATAGVR